MADTGETELQADIDESLVNPSPSDGPSEAQAHGYE